MLAVTGWAWGHISASTQIPIHFNARGAPNTYVNKQVGLLLIPAFALAVSAFFFLMPAIDPRGTNLPRSREAYNASWLAAVGLLTVIHMVTVLNAVGRHTDRRNLIGAAVGVALVIMGNYMGKLRSNFFIGFRNPWTLSSELSWNRTHRLGGRLLVLAGICTVAAAVFGVALTALIVSVVLVVAVTTIYSYTAWRADPGRRITSARSADGIPRG